MSEGAAGARDVRAVWIGCSVRGLPRAVGLLTDARRRMTATGDPFDAARAPSPCAARPAHLAASTTQDLAGAMRNRSTQGAACAAGRPGCSSSRHR